MKIWTVEKIKEGFERFKKEHGRLPRAPEIDQLEYLPSSRNIQKRFGGLARLRNQLGYSDVHFGKGSFRSEIASRVNDRGRKTELALEKVLRERFGKAYPDPLVSLAGLSVHEKFHGGSRLPQG